MMVGVWTVSAAPPSDGETAVAMPVEPLTLPAPLEPDPGPVVSGLGLDPDSGLAVPSPGLDPASHGDHDGAYAGPAPPSRHEAVSVMTLYSIQSPVGPNAVLYVGP
jgi:hypothetical protein